MFFAIPLLIFNNFCYRPLTKAKLPDIFHDMLFIQEKLVCLDHRVAKLGSGRI